MYYFIVNPNARSGGSGKIWRRLKKILESSGAEYEAFVTEQPGDARRFAKGLTEGCREPRVIVAVGGDGTVNEVVDGLSFCGPITLGYIPAGSGNDLAKSLRLPRRPSRCLKKILHPKYHKLLDYGVLSYGEDEISYRRFMVSAGIGMDAAVCHNLLYSRAKKALNRVHLGKLTYVTIGLKQLLRAKPSKGYLLLDGVKKVEFNHIYFVSVHVHPYEGGGFKFAPRASCDDGLLTLCVMNTPSKRRLVPVLLNALRGRLSRNKGVRTYECREAVIHTERPMAVHVDGESCFCQKDIQISCIGRKIRMIV